MKNFLFTYPVGVLLLLFGAASCNTGPDPKETCDFPPGNREFSWRADTVAWWPSTLGGVWAFADDDAYVMGSIWKETGEEREFHLGLHWNGEEWSHDINGTVEEIKHVANDVTGDDYYMVSVGNWSINPPKPGIGEFDNRAKEWKGYQFETAGELREVWTDGKGFFMAVGDNGMVYTKDGHETEWVYSKAPTEFNLREIDGVSKNELYIRGYLSLPAEPVYDQLWKYTGSEWYKLYDNQDTSDIYLYLEGAMDARYSGVADVAAWRCPVTDSLQLYIIDNESFLVSAKGQALSYEVVNLSEKGLTLRQNQSNGRSIDLFTPNDVWIYGTRYNFYHWNGSNFQKVIIPGLPNDDRQFGFQRKMQKTESGKIFFPTEVSPDVYVVVQGVPLSAE
ncbi:MAG: hypothetical protein WD361_06375 [Gracilimonas sp.]